MHLLTSYITRLSNNAHELTTKSGYDNNRKGGDKNRKVLCLLESSGRAACGARLARALEVAERHPHAAVRRATCAALAEGVARASYAR